MPDLPRLTIIGEALVDLLPSPALCPGCYQAKPGGSPFNVVIGLARLGHRTALMARLADDGFGALLRAPAAEHIGPRQRAARGGADHARGRRARRPARFSKLPPHSSSRRFIRSDIS